MKFFDGRDFEYAETLYHHVDCERTLRIVLIRSLRADHTSRLFAQADYDYAAFATDIGMHEKSAVDVLREYRKRSNAENIIREMRNGIDTRRFQCRRLVANNALASAAAFANAFLSFLAHIQNKNLVHFAKRPRRRTVRNKLIFLPCQVVKHGRNVVFRLMEKYYQEVNIWLKNYNIKLDTVYSQSERKSRRRTARFLAVAPPTKLTNSQFSCVRLGTLRRCSNRFVTLRFAAAGRPSDA